MSLATDARRKFYLAARKLGSTFTLKRVNPGSYDASTGLVASPSITLYAGLYGFLQSYAARDIAGSILATDRRCTLAPDGLETTPVVGDRVLDAQSVEYEVVNVGTNVLNDVIIAYSLQLRRGGHG